MIRLDSVTKVYRGGARPALDAVSLEIGSGEFVFLVGASGSGKSTLLRLMLREEKPSNGEIHVLGQRLTSISSRKVPLFRRNLGVVFQDFRLLPNKTVYDNVAFTLQVIGKSRGFIQEAVPDVLGMVGLAEKAGRLPHELSGGEQQRVAIARAVVNKPKILLADEPTGNLDPTTSLEIMQVLERINLSGTTVVMATHDVSIVDRLQKRVVEIEGGHIIRDELEGAYVTTAIPVQSAPEPESSTERRPAWARGAGAGVPRLPDAHPSAGVPRVAPPTPVSEPVAVPLVIAPVTAPVMLEPAAPSPAEVVEPQRVEPQLVEPQSFEPIVTGAAVSAWSLFAAPEEPAAAASVDAEPEPAGTPAAEPVEDPISALRARVDEVVQPATSPIARPVFVAPEEPRTPPWAARPPAAEVVDYSPETDELPTVHPGLDDWDTTVPEPAAAAAAADSASGDAALDGTALGSTAPDDTAPDGTAPENTAPENTAEPLRPAARSWFDAARAVPLPASADDDQNDQNDDHAQQSEPRPYRRTFPREMLEGTGAVTVVKSPAEVSEAEKAVRTFTGPIDLSDTGDQDSLSRRYGKHRVELPAHLDFVGRLGLRDDSAESEEEEVGPSS